jgi:hypothetical protein
MAFKIEKLALNDTYNHQIQKNEETMAYAIGQNSWSTSKQKKN